MSDFQEKVEVSFERIKTSVLTQFVFSLPKLSRRQSLDIQVDFSADL